MKNFCLHPIFQVSENDFSEGVYIILFNANSLPPHLLLSVDGKVYAISDAGRQMGSPLGKLLLFIKRKNIPALFIEWNVESSILRTRENFMKYEKVIEEKVSCLFPIRDTVADVLGDEMKKADFIFELLPLMEKVNALGKVFALNMEKLIVNERFELLTYTNHHLKEAIQSSLK
ncbi:MAG: hypothetical protein M3R17_00740 [Bacteroidota bacterium]|nr:hypothetical protein [Bacteroidota bacterium]